MTQYEELMRQARDLMAQADAVRKSEISTVIKEIKDKMRQYGISISDLGGHSAEAAKATKLKREAKYKGPNGELWGGGQGRRPLWVQDILKSGGDIEKYRI